MIDHPPPPDILMDARQETMHVSAHCSGERYVCDIPEFGGGPRFSRYEVCDRKETCARYMSPYPAAEIKAVMRMPEEKPCPHWKEWKHDRDRDAALLLPGIPRSRHSRGRDDG